MLSMLQTTIGRDNKEVYVYGWGKMRWQCGMIVGRVKDGNDTKAIDK